MRVIWLQHLSPHWSPGLIWLIWLARPVSPSFFTANRGEPVFGQGYKTSCIPLLELPNKLPRISPSKIFLEKIIDFALPSYPKFTSV